MKTTPVLKHIIPRQERKKPCFYSYLSWAFWGRRPIGNARDQRLVNRRSLAANARRFFPPPAGQSEAVMPPQSRMSVSWRALLESSGCAARPEISRAAVSSSGCLAARGRKVRPIPTGDERGQHRHERTLSDQCQGAAAVQGHRDQAEQRALPGGLQEIQTRRSARTVMQRR